MPKEYYNQDFMYFNEVLWQKKRRIQKERWYERERNKEISVLKKTQEFIMYSKGDVARMWCVNDISWCPPSFKKRNKNTAMMIEEREGLLLSSKVVGIDCWQEKNSKGFKKRLKLGPLSLLMIRGWIILKREGMIQSGQWKKIRFGFWRKMRNFLVLWQQS